MFNKIKTLSSWSSKNQRRLIFSKNQCILPEAVTPLQKTFCATTALVGLITSGFVGYHAYGWLNDIYQKRQKDKKTDNEKNIKQPYVTASSLRHKVPEYIFHGTLLTLEIIAATTSVFCMYHVNKITYHDIKNSTKCCK